MKSRSKTLIILIATLFSLTNLALADNLGKSDNLIFGVAPSKKAENSASQWKAFIDYLSANSDTKIQLQMAASVEDFEQQLAHGTYDVVFMNSYQYTTYHQSQGYVAFAKDKKKKVKGIIVVRKDSPFKSLVDLKDQSVGFPKEDVFGASLLPRATLQQENIPVKTSYVDTSTSVYRAVYKGKLPAGAGVMETYDELNPAVNNKLRILWSTKQYTPDAFAVHPRVTKSTLDKIKHTLFVMQDDPHGLTVLNASNIRGIEAAQDKDWDNIRALSITLMQ